MGDMDGGTFIADILCNNQMYIVLGGGYYRYGLSLISVVVCLIPICWEEQTFIHTTNYSNQKDITINCISSQLDRKHVKHKFVMISTMLCIHIFWLY